MILQDLNDGKKETQDPGEVDLMASSSVLSPLSEEATDQSMLDSFKHVSIPPSIPAPDESTVDIRIEDDDISLEQTETPPIKSFNSLYLTPFRASQDVLSHSSRLACRILRFTEVTLPENSKSSIKQRSNSLSSSVDSSAPANSLTGFTSPPTSLPALTADEMMEALPHRSALFLPDSMEWFVLLLEQDIRRDGTVDNTIWPPSNFTSESTVPLWRIEGEIQILKEQQANPICTLMSSEEDSPGELGALEMFDCWRSTKESSILMNKRGSLASVVPVSLMERFREERIANPRAGWTGEIQFKEAISMLIKIVGNAANGEVRALSITGKAMTNKLGIDDLSQSILGILGFSADGKADEDGKYSLIKPPDMSQKIWQIKLRRAWLELVLWYQHKRSPPHADAFWKEILPCIPLNPEFGSSRNFLEQMFEFDSEVQVDPNIRYVRPHISDALKFLGADGEATEEIVEQCYVANTAGRSKSERLPFFSALQIAAQHFSDSPGSEGNDVIQTRLGIEKSQGLFSESDLKSAFAKIGIEVDSFEEAKVIANDFVLSVYQGAVNNVAANKEEVHAIKEALEIISASRDRPEEMEEQIMAPVELSLEKAYEILEVNHDTDDDFISSVYAVAVVDGSKSGTDCTEALRIIAENRNSISLRKVYRNAIGEVDEWEPADMAIPIGLNNIGNTCYLNSVLQYFFAIQKLREQVILASQEDEEEKAKSSSRSSVRVGGRQVTRREIERSQRFVGQLGMLFSNMTSAPTSAVTPERELAYLALVSSRVEETSKVADAPTVLLSSSPSAEPVSMMEEPPPVTDLKLTTTIEENKGWAEMKPTDSDESMGAAEENGVEELSSTDADGIVTPPLPGSEAPPLPARPRSLALQDYEVGQRRNSLMQLGAQQDVSECLDNVMFQIEVALTASEHDGQQQAAGEEEQLIEMDDGWIEDGDLLRRLFLGRTLQRLELASMTMHEAGQIARGPSIHTKREVFTILPIDVVEEERDIYDGLDGFFEEEILTGSAGESIRRTVTLTDGPAIMQIQLQRVQYDRVKGVYKSQAHLEVGQTLFMDRYLDFDPLDPADVPRLEKRKKGREARKRIADLRARLRALEPAKSPVAQTLRQTGHFLTSLGALNGKSKVKEESDGEEKQSDLQTLLDPAFSQYLGEEASRVEEEILQAKKEVDELKKAVQELWKDEKRMEYILASVFMHRGEASHGHYFLNQRKLTQEDKEPSSVWYKYNDQTVTEVTWNDVHRDQSGATPYLLCWVRRDKLDHFDTLCRKSETIAAKEESSLRAETTQVEDIAPRVTETILTDKAEATSSSTSPSKQADDTIMADIPDNLED